MEVDDPGMMDCIPEDEDEEMFALLGEHCPDPEPITGRRSSFLQRRLTFSSPIRPGQSCFADPNPSNENSSTPGQSCLIDINSKHDNSSTPGQSCLIDLNYKHDNSINPGQSCLSDLTPDAGNLNDPGQSCLVELNPLTGTPNAPTNSVCGLPDNRGNSNNRHQIGDDQPDWALPEEPPNEGGDQQPHRTNVNEQLRTLSQDYREYQPVPDIDLTRPSTVPEQDRVVSVDLCQVLGDQLRAHHHRNRYSAQTQLSFYDMFDNEADGLSTVDRSLLSLKRMPAHSNFVTITSSLGGAETRLYLMRTSPEHYQSKIQRVSRRWHQNMNRNQLLNESVEVLLERIERKRIEQLVRDEEASLALAENMMISDLNSADETSLSSRKRRYESEGQSSSHESSMLFVDRFAPRTFIELLSDSKTNREVLQWVQAWDPVVFHHAPRIRPKANTSSNDQSTKSPFPSRFRGSSFSSKRARPAPWLPHNPGFERGPDQTPDDHRPFPRSLLFAGPPGSGKTTLAHCIARQAGYNVIEINASDDRSVSTLRSKIYRAISMEAVFGACKPNLVIIDEIDGVDDPAAIRALIDIITDSAVVESRKKSSKKKSQKSMLLQRPIICICNDLYAKALRSLRAHVLTFNFVEPTSAALQQRISHICAQTGLQMESAAFRYICDSSRNDIRSTLQVLQFVAANARITGRVKVQRQDVLSFVSDHKDLAFDNFSIWKAAFHQDTKVNDTIEAVSSGKDPSRIVEGLFELYINMPFSDPSMSKTLLVADCFSHTDALSAACMGRPSFSMRPYSSLIAGTIHHYCSLKHVPRMTLPKQSFQYSRDVVQTQDTISRLNSQYTRRITEHSMVTDFIPALYHIITPRVLRSESTMMSNQDEQVLRRVSAIMQHYGLSFTTVSDTVKGQICLDLQPDISRFCTYSTADGDAHLYRLPRLWVERIAQALTTTSSSRPLPAHAYPPLKTQTSANVEQGKGWQGSFKQESDRPQLAASEPMVRFRYNEGFTQAVRRAVLIRAFVSAKPS